ncbi:nickel pincer cofactor biosynthesis protein LarC [Butyrivibrio sp. AE2032]|uniref:nickel pincer cofactor biosynthesis protein LarC n=1 Tax=Butyrivibrio sp. AE2032 TaxID=1458463 RepID=UPI00068A4745|nr:nickel pincer cofactor biosynthesis protein LarC [Butyrivibrio sp. AE2032]
MKTLYIECNMGAAGDMLLASLAELTGDVKACEEKLNSIGIPDVTYQFEESVKCGIKGTHAHVTALGVEEDEHLHEHTHEGHVHSHEHTHEHEHDHTHGGEEHHHEHGDHEHGDHEHHHHHAHMSDIENIINGLNVSEKVKSDALAVYGLIAEAESKAHGRPVTDIHFHEVGTMDAVADIVGVCVLLEQIDPDRIVVSPLATGFGQVRCAHGILPVPAPATASIIEGVPTYSGDVEGELLTPTGAALLKHFADSFGSRPVMAIEKTGYGMGKKDFPKANMLRTFIGTSEGEGDKVVELRFNVDDMTGEEIGYATGVLMDSGALDVFTTPVFMKKNRPGILFTVLVKAEEKEKFAGLIFENTSTIGIRYVEMDRFKLARREEKVMTRFGEVRVKVSEGFGVTKAKPEFDDVADIADRK